MFKMVETSIPRHITVMYIFTVVNFLAMLCVTGVDGDIIVKDIDSNMTMREYEDMQAGFGSNFPDKGLEGRVIYAEPHDACSPLKNPAPAQEGIYVWILLIARGGGCEFADKVLNAQIHNFSGAIVHNSAHDNRSRIHMGGTNGSHVKIPSTFVGWSTGMDLANHYDYHHKEYIIKIIEENPINYRLYLWPFAIVIGVCFLLVIVFLIIKFLRDHASRRINRLSKRHLKKIPVRKFKKGDYYDTCAICLDEYEDGEKIRVLPCDHVYHTKCIDPWLTKNKKTCPVCKRRVIPGRNADSDSDSDVEEGGAASSESTPLLGGGSSQQSHPAPRAEPEEVDDGNDSDYLPTSIQTRQVLPRPSGSRLEDYGAMAPAREAETGAVGGVGISDKPSRSQGGTSHAPEASTSSAREVGNERKKRKRQDRRARREEEASHQDAGDSSPNATVVSETREERRERRKKKKEKKKLAEKKAGNPKEDRAQSTRNKEDGKLEEEQKEEEDEEFFASAHSSLRETEGLLTRIEEEDGGHESYINPSYSESQEVTLPRGDRRQEMNEVV